MHYSFDIFDTCLIRTCGYPHNVFDLLALKLLGRESSESARVDFVNIRMQAEKRAREKKQTEVTLQDIYNECDFTDITSLTKEQIAKEEIDIERNVLVPIHAMQTKISELHKKNIPIFFISDMYLPESFIKELLINNGFWKEGDKLYVSCTSGKTKHNGSLFDLVAKENNLSYKQWQHWGDNYQSDYITPKRKGIKAHLVSHEFSNYEKQLLDLCYYPNTFLNQRLAGIQKAVRLSTTDNNPQIALASNITIPLLTAFVYNILEDAKQKGINRLFFLARDGRMPYHIATLLQDKYPDIQFNYIYTSRSALYFPGIVSFSKENIYKLLGNLEGKNIYEVFIDRTNIDISSFLTKEEKDKIITSESEATSILERLFANHDFMSVLATEYQKQKEMILAYFIQEGMANNSQAIKSAIVDIRGTRTSHQVINRLLTDNGYNKVEGYYLEVTSDRKNIAQAGNYYADFYTERFYNGNRKLIYMSCIYAVIEQYFCVTGESRTIKYKKENDKIVPVYENGSKSAYGQDLCSMHEKIANDYIQYYKCNFLDLYNKELLFLIYHNVCAFSYLPYKADLYALKDIKVNDDQFHYRHLIRKYSVMDILRKKYHKDEWYRGCLVYTIYSWLGEKWGRKLINYLNQ